MGTWGEEGRSRAAYWADIVAWAAWQCPPGPLQPRPLACRTAGASPARAWPPRRWRTRSSAPSCRWACAAAAQQRRGPPAAAPWAGLCRLVGHFAKSVCCNCGPAAVEGVCAPSPRRQPLADLARPLGAPMQSCCQGARRQPLRSCGCPLPPRPATRRCRRAAQAVPSSRSTSCQRPGTASRWGRGGPRLGAASLAVCSCRSCVQRCPTAGGWQGPGHVGGQASTVINRASADRHQRLPPPHAAKWPRLAPSNPPTPHLLLLAGQRRHHGGGRQPGGGR
jgi:hypothetical protein